MAPAYYLGRHVNAGADEHADESWWFSSDAFATPASTIHSATPTDPRYQHTTDFPPAAGGYLSAGYGAAVLDGVLYYASANYLWFSEDPVIYSYDGTTDALFCTIPARTLPNPTSAEAILSLIAANGKLYCTVYDGNNGAGGENIGRVFEIDPVTGTPTLMGTEGDFDAQEDCPYALAYDSINNYIWLGTAGRLVTGAQRCHLYYWDLDAPGTWNLDFTGAASGGEVERGFLCLAEYQGDMYAGSFVDGGAVGNALHPRVIKRTGVGAWSTVITKTTGAAANWSSFRALGVSPDDLLYASYFENATSPIAIIVEWDGASATDLTAGLDNVPYTVFLNDGTNLWAAGGGRVKASANLPASLVKLVAGVWTNLTTNLDASNFAPPTFAYVDFSSGVLRGFVVDAGPNQEAQGPLPSTVHIDGSIITNGDHGVFEKLWEQVSGPGLLAQPDAPTVEQVGTPGVVTYAYLIVAVGTVDDHSKASAETTTLTGNATLNGTNFNRISGIVPNSGMSGYDIYRTVGGVTQGKIGSVPTQLSDEEWHFDDTGLVGDATTAPTEATAELDPPTITPDDDEVTDITFNVYVPGLYVFRLTVTDPDSGFSDFAEMQIKIPGITAPKVSSGFRVLEFS